MSKRKRVVLISVVSAVVLLMIALPIIIVAIKKNNKKYELDGFSIANFQNLTAIGAGQIDSSGVTNVVDGVKDNSKECETKLIGYHKDGTCEQIRFEDEKGNKKTQKPNLIHFNYYKNFSFAVYSLDDEIANKYIEYDQCRYEFMKNSLTKNEYGIQFVENNHTDMSSYPLKYLKFFIIDNNSGKIYDFEKILNKVYENKKCYGSVSFLNINNGVMLYDYESLYIKVKEEDNEGVTKYSIHQIDFFEDRIELKERITKEQYENFASTNEVFSGPPGVFPDRFGNIISFHSGISGEEREIKYQTKTGGFKTFVAENAHLSFNGILYYREGDVTKYLNENGELVEIDFNEELFSVINYLQTENLVFYGDSKTMYLYINDSLEYRHAIKKITIDDELIWKYKVEIVKLDDNDSYVVSNNITRVTKGNLLYELKNQEITCYDMTTGASSHYESIYKFKDLKYNKHLDRVTFKAVDQSIMLDVDGYFDANNQVVLGDFKDVKNNISKIYTIKPIN